MLTQPERVRLRNTANWLLVCCMSACVFRSTPEEMLGADNVAAGSGSATTIEDSAGSRTSNSAGTAAANLGSLPAPSTPGATAGGVARAPMQPLSGSAATGTTSQAGQGGAAGLPRSNSIAGVGSVGVDAGALTEEELAALSNPACGLLLSACLPLDPGNLKGCVAQCTSGAAGASP